MLIFLDCEFTDFLDFELISLGMVSEDGQHEFYAERNDYEKGKCNQFVREAVEPLLGRFPDAACTRDELTARLWAWFATLPRPVQIVSDSMHDRDLLWDAFDEGLPPNLDRSVFDLRPLIDTTAFNDAVCRYHDQPNQPWHHALYDARAHRAGWFAWIESRRLTFIEGRGLRVLLKNIPERGREEFLLWIQGQAFEMVDGEPAFFPQDWERWCAKVSETGGG